MLTGPLTFAPVELPGGGGKRYQIQGDATLGGVFTTEGVPNGIRNVVNALEIEEFRRVPVLLTA